ncbi:uncharacterized protein MELLADRAFT_106703 [Melampsora larici-populina 98AG31]|uniref:Uncharacterized protein n=1 Tax=Melampsora larici-populina (strain 98AG31 / pathotype 3-4-7) TaxID=747676 RepID=F4RMD0_MELLP|nr:uncharacterized protein MELLADRAFT_106703 [Melampsora larici-populina 98AG31]EGG06495.1 hypothetical protein MELLADRAFT_106703 [Melampsora larici-populina 98AG31]
MTTRTGSKPAQIGNHAEPRNESEDALIERDTSLVEDDGDEGNSPAEACGEDDGGEVHGDALKDGKPPPDREPIKVTLKNIKFRKMAPPDPPPPSSGDSSPDSSDSDSSELLSDAEEDSDDTEICKLDFASRKFSMGCKARNNTKPPHMS